MARLVLRVSKNQGLANVQATRRWTRSTWYWVTRGTKSTWTIPPTIHKRTWYAEHIYLCCAS